MRPSKKSARRDVAAGRQRGGKAAAGSIFGRVFIEEIDEVGALILAPGERGRAIREFEVAGSLLALDGLDQNAGGARRGQEERFAL